MPAGLYLETGCRQRGADARCRREHLRRDTPAARADAAPVGLSAVT